MIAEFGNLALYLLVLQSVGFAMWFGASMLITPMHTPNLQHVLWAWSATFLCTILTMLALIYCYCVSDFSVLNVYNNSSTHKPLLYKIVGAWGNHEGSMLLWLISLSGISWLFALLHCWRPNTLESAKLVSLTLIIQLLLLAAFVVYVIWVSNPFTRLFPAPVQGLGLNPLLQDIGLAVHPPSLYLGYVGFSLVYSGVIAALLLRAVNSRLAKMLLPWVMFSWTILTAGIALGSWWAYRELGWGGFWFWDPVENISLLPWLSATALLHSLLALKKSETFKHWSVVFAIATFALSMVGTLIVRSGLVTSVHAFALDPERGFFMINMLAIIIGLALLIYASRALSLRESNSIYYISREALLLLNNILLLVAIAIILIATFYPMLLQLFTGQQITVGAPYFNATFIPLSIGSVIACIMGSACAWQKDSLTRLIKLHKMPMAVAGIIAVVSIACFFPIVARWNIFCVFVGSWLLCLMGKLFWQTRKNHAMFLAHSGLAILVIALALHFMGKEEMNRSVQLNEKIAVAGYEIQPIDVSDKAKDNYYARRVIFKIYHKGVALGTLAPENRLFLVEQQVTRESAILQGTWGDLYITIGDVHAAESGGLTISVHVAYNPMMAWVWFGCLLMVMGGGISFLRRL